MVGALQGPQEGLHQWRMPPICPINQLLVGWVHIPVVGTVMGRTGGSVPTMLPDSLPLGKLSESQCCSSLPLYRRKGERAEHCGILDVLHT